MRTEDFDFYLPKDLIAQHPTEKRSESRLLHLKSSENHLNDLTFNQLIEHLNQNDVLILNNTKVIKARLFGKKASGGAVEILVERVLNEQLALAYIKSSKSPKAGTFITINDKVSIEILGREDNLFRVKFLCQQDILSILERFGQLPLPPYIEHAADQDDASRYQTVFAEHEGAVAAPTAGLHFDEALINAIKQKGVKIAFVTLHVGAGTFQPVKVDNIHDHKMHSERYVISEETVQAIEAAKHNNGKVVAVGTTVLRTLESAVENGTLKAKQGETNIFIYPGFKFQVVDTLITNFHLPKSTLMMLVSAFAGYEQIKMAYAHAINKQYRFFSYGDAMLLERLER